MKTLITIFTVLFFLSCVNNKENETLTDPPYPKYDSTVQEGNVKSTHDVQSETTACNSAATDILKLRDKIIQADFFHQLDSIRKVQYPNNDQDTAIFVDFTPILLNRFLKDVNKEQLTNTGEFEKEYNFNISPPQYKDSKECKDKISLTFDKETCSFHITIFNEFFAEWCQESSVTYLFQIVDSKISNFTRSETG